MRLNWCRNSKSMPEALEDELHERVMNEYDLDSFMLRAEF